MQQGGDKGMKKAGAKMSAKPSMGKKMSGKSSASASQGFPIAAKERKMKADRKMGGCR